MKTMLWALALALTPLSIFAQKHTISGHVTDAESGEELIGATIYVEELKSGAVTNVYGFYSITLEQGTYHLTYSFVGFQPVKRTIDLTSDIKMDIELGSGSETLQEVVIEAEAKDQNVTSVEMSKVNMKMETIKEIPALMGEVDVIKAIQLLPGVQTVGEGTSGFYVRGGGVDQNMIMLDEATVYNASHLMGFFSVFNSDAIKGLQLYKGGIPAEYGGRLSSVLDIRMKDGNNKKFAATGGIGTISSRLTLEGPIMKDKMSFLISGRRTYADQFLRFSPDTNVRKNKLYFYDLNGKWNWKVNDNNRLFVSAYTGEDVFKFADLFKLSWGNQTVTARWNHIFSNKLFMNLTGIYSRFDYGLGATSGVESFSWDSDIKDYSGKLDFNYFLNPKNTVRFGLISTYHIFNPGFARGEGEESIFNELKLQDSYALESALYISNEQKIGARITTRYGLRYSDFRNFGPGDMYGYDENYNVNDTTSYSSGEQINRYGGFEPRLGINYLINEEQSLKASYNRTRQYVQLASNSTASSPLDIWFPASKNVEPQIADQVAIGYFRNLKKNTYEASVEAYYKWMQNSIDFKDHAQLLLNPQLEGELRFGEARAYGLEFMVKKQEGKLTGWVSYTLARAERKIESINNGNWYKTKYDKLHDVSVVASYELSKRMQLGMTWVFGTGQAVTMPTGRMQYANMLVPVYSDRNAARMPAYHRMDLGLTVKPNPDKENKTLPWSGEWVFSIYNAYNRHNAFAINFRQDPENPNETIAEKVYLFPIIPAVTYNFKF